ncbi:uncharacterized protein [Diadema setosum]|uniref:uncharacterized protein n=1 Tax=Diadema setosum TaxID=31175 RepID=UPI003B3A091A
MGYGTRRGGRRHHRPHRQHHNHRRHHRPNHAHRRRRRHHHGNRGGVAVVGLASAVHGGSSQPMTPRLCVAILLTVGGLFVGCVGLVLAIVGGWSASGTGIAGMVIIAVSACVVIFTQCVHHRAVNAQQPSGDVEAGAVTSGVPPPTSGGQPVGMAPVTNATGATLVMTQIGDGGITMFYTQPGAYPGSQMPVPGAETTAYGQPGFNVSGAPYPPQPNTATYPPQPDATPAYVATAPPDQVVAPTGNGAGAVSTATDAEPPPSYTEVMSGAATIS